MKILIRADSGAVIGSGHIMRCLSLADQLRAQGHDILFVGKAHPGNIHHVVRQHGFPVSELEKRPDDLSSGLAHAAWVGGCQLEDARLTRQIAETSFAGKPDWVIVDHYGLDHRWHKQMVSAPTQLFVIDDLADRQLACDLLLDQTVGRQPSAYQGLLPEHCVALTGSEYALLRPEFAVDSDAIRQKRKRSASLGPSSLLVMMGGTDPLDVTTQVLDALTQARFLKRVTVVLGPTAVHLDTVSLRCAQEGRIQLLVGVDNIAELMIQHDLAIGAAGTSSWERCALGLPSVITITADNQRSIAKKLAELGAILSLDLPIEAAQINSHLTQLSDAYNYLNAVEASLRVCDGQGCNRVISCFLQNNSRHIQ